MTRFITVISGKGGVAKTTTAINLGVALNMFGKDVTVVDANLTTPNVGLYLGAPVVPINLHHVLQGKHHVTDALYMLPCGIKMVPASIALQDLKGVRPDHLSRAMKGLDKTSDVVLIDAAAGLGREALAAVDSADELLVVTNAELPAITDALKTIKLAEELKKPVIGVVLTRSRADELDVSIRNIETILEKPVIAVIPFDEAVREALQLKDAVVLTHPRSRAAVGYKKLAASLLGREWNEEAAREFKIFNKIMRKFGLRRLR
ncbi:MAG: cell division ATPase MinD [archaeon]